MEINDESSESGYCILPVSILRNLNVLATSLSQLEVNDEAIQSMEKDYVVLEMTKSSDGSIAFEDVSTADAASEILMQYDVIRELTSLDIREDLVEMFTVVVRHQELQRGLLEMRMCFTENRWWAEWFRDLCQRLAWAFDDACFVAEEDSGPNDGYLRPSLFGGVRDCVVLTSPGVEIICGDEKKACWSFSWEVWDAVQRCEQFVGAATSVANVNAIWPSMATCRQPRGFVVAGRSVGWSGEQFLRLDELNRDLNGIAVLTFDQLLLRGRETLLLLNERVAAAYRGRIDFPGCGFISDEDVPF